jgi:hypothetical protein
MSLDQEAVQSASAALPDEHLQSAPAGEATKVEQPQAQPDPAAQTAEPATAQTHPAEGNEPQNPDAQPQDAPKKRNGVQTRIDELTRERYEAQRQAEYWRQQAEAKAQAPQQPAKPAPKIEDFPDVNQFLEARDAWIMEQAEARVIGRLTEAQQRQQIEAQRHQQNIAVQQTVERFTAQEEDARGRYADYDAAVSSPLMQQVKQVRPDVIQAVIDSPHGPDVAYFLAKNPARVQQIASLSAVAAAREIGRIEQMFMGQKQATTQAPPPPRTVGGEAKVDLDPSNMTMKEYRAWRAKQR